VADLEPWQNVAFDLLVTLKMSACGSLEAFILQVMNKGYDGSRAQPEGHAQ
jgi:hypothetical protein